MSKKKKFYVVWHSKNNPGIEGVIFESEEDAMVAAGQLRTNPCCTLADDFSELNEDNELEIMEVRFALPQQKETTQ